MSPIKTPQYFEDGNALLRYRDYLLEGDAPGSPSRISWRMRFVPTPR